MDATTRFALQAARLHYLEDLPMRAVAARLGVSPSKVSRAIAWARANGLVEVRVHASDVAASTYEERLLAAFGVQALVVATPPGSSESERLHEVARFAAGQIGQEVGHGSTLAIAWGTTVRAIGAYLSHRPVRDVQVVQLNGSGNTHDAGVSYSIEILRAYAAAFDATIQPFTVPTFFDHPETKRCLWRERSVQRILELQNTADVLLYSIGAVRAGVPSHVYTGDYLDQADLAALRVEGVVGDIATVFFRADGSWRDIPINQRASGPDLNLFRRAKTALCVVSGEGKADGLLAAMRGGYVQRLIVDDATARRVLTMAAGSD